MSRHLCVPVIALAVLTCTGRATAQSLVVDAAHVEQGLKSGAIVWDARDAAAYADGHIPGAVNVGRLSEQFVDPTREDPPSAAVASRFFGDAGIDILHKEVIVYSNTGDAAAYFAARMAEYFGGRHGRVYHGGIEDWKAAGRPLSKEPTRLPPVTLPLSAEWQGAVTTKDVVERVRGGTAQIVDVRTPREYSGEDVRALRGGHIPGAVHVPYEQNWRDPATAARIAAGETKDRSGMTLKTPDELKALYAKLDPSKETIVYCQSGGRASQTAAVLRSIGFTDVKVYESSWLGYAGTLSAPVENETFVNVWALRNQITALQRRVTDLEAEVTRLRGEVKR